MLLQHELQAVGLGNSRAQPGRPPPYTASRDSAPTTSATQPVSCAAPAPLLAAGAASASLGAAASGPACSVTAGAPATRATVTLGVRHFRV